MNIIVFGELPIATKILQFLESYESVVVPFVVCDNYNAKNADPWPETPMLFTYANERNIPVISLEQLEIYTEKLDSKPTIGITARFSKILKESHLECFSQGIINLHGGLLPEFGGLFSVNHMLLSGSSIGGGSIHWIDLGIDTGRLIKRCVCEIEEQDNAFMLHHKVQKSLYEGIKEVLVEGLETGFENISHDQIPADSETAYYSKNSLLGLKEIKLPDLGGARALNTIRAFDFPGYEPAYLIIDGKKIYLRLMI